MSSPHPEPPCDRTMPSSHQAECTSVHEATDLEGNPSGSPAITGHSPTSNSSTSLSEVDEDLIAGHESLDPLAPQTPEAAPAPRTPQAPKAARFSMARLAIEPRAQSDTLISRMTERELDPFLAVEIPVASPSSQTRACTSPPAGEEGTRSVVATPEASRPFGFFASPSEMEGFERVEGPDLWGMPWLSPNGGTFTPSGAASTPTGATFNMPTGPRRGFSLLIDDSIAEVVEDDPMEDHTESVPDMGGFAEISQDHPMEDQIEPATPVAAAPAAPQLPPPVTPTSASRRASMVAGRLAITHVRGPRKEFAEYLRPALDKWHDENFNEPPEWALRLRASQASNWERFQVFGREGEEHDLSIYSVTVMTQTKGRKPKYMLMVLHSEGAQDEFVGTSTCRPAKGKGAWQGLQGTYLIAWNCQRKCWESQIAAIRVWFPKGHKGKGPVAFHPRMFDKAVGNIYPARRGKGKEEIEEDSDSDSDVETPPKPARKKAKIRVDSKGSPTRLSDPTNVARALYYSPNVRIKLSNKDTVRFFPLDGCDVKKLFSKARQFYGDEKMSASAKTGLACKLAGMNEVRFIGENCADEWELLCRDVRDLTFKEEGTHSVEVAPAEVGQGDEMNVGELRR